MRRSGTETEGKLLKWSKNCMGKLQERTRKWRPSFLREPVRGEFKCDKQKWGNLTLGHIYKSHDLLDIFVFHAQI